MARSVDLTGQKFERLLVVGFSHRNKSGKSYWRCKCDCGNEKEIVVQGYDLKRGHTKSCGCIEKEHPNATIHGLSHTKTHSEWRNMKQRCYNKNCDRYYTHGARGIKVCDRWRNSFEAFYEDVSKLPHFEEKGYSLNRINNDGDYEPNNVEWADDIAQANNKSNNHLITFDGETYTTAEWARIKNIPPSTLRNRINVLRWTAEKALNTPVRKLTKK